MRVSSVHTSFCHSEPENATGTSKVLRRPFAYSDSSLRTPAVLVSFASYHLTFLALIFPFFEARPKVLRGVGAPGSPSLGEGGHAPPVTRMAEPLDGLFDPEVRGEERVRIAERTHCDVGDGPRPDPTQPQ